MDIIMKWFGSYIQGPQDLRTMHTPLLCLLIPTLCFYLVGDSHLQEVDFPTALLSAYEMDVAIGFLMFDYPRNDLWIIGNGLVLTYLPLFEVQGIPLLR
jgi:hypothetical protein